MTKKELKQMLDRSIFVRLDAGFDDDYKQQLLYVLYDGDEMIGSWDTLEHIPESLQCKAQKIPTIQTNQIFYAVLKGEGKKLANRYRYDIEAFNIKS